MGQALDNYLEQNGVGVQLSRTWAVGQICAHPRKEGDDPAGLQIGTLSERGLPVTAF